MSPTMREKPRLIQKVKQLLRRAGLPRWLHRFGPKKYEFWQHALVLLVKQECKQGYRRACNLLRELGHTVPTYSAVAKMACRLPASLWQRLLVATISFTAVAIAAIDSTGLSRSNPSYHYIRRIDRDGPVGRAVKLSILVDTRRRKILAARFRALPTHDVRDVKCLLKRTPITPRKIVGDSAYDDELNVFKPCHDRNIIAVVKPYKTRKNGFYRRKMRKHYDLRTYHRRPCVESAFGALKQKYGGSVRCHTARTQRAEVFCRLILHNLSLWLSDFFNAPGASENYINLNAALKQSFSSKG